MIACGFFSAMALGLVATLSIYFYTYYWELSADQVSLLLLSALISAAAALALAPVITRRLDKKRGAIVASIISLALAPAPIILRECGWFVDNSSPALLPHSADFYPRARHDERGFRRLGDLDAGRYGGGERDSYASTHGRPVFRRRVLCAEVRLGPRHLYGRFGARLGQISGRRAAGAACRLAYCATLRLLTCR